MDKEESRERKPAPRWFDEEGQGPPTPPPRGLSNTRRAPDAPKESETRSWNLFNWLLLAILVVLVLSYTYLKDEPMPWEEGLRREPFTEKTIDLSAPARMKVLLNAAAKFHEDELPSGHPWLWDTPTLVRVLEQRGAVLDDFRDLLEEKEQEWQPRSSLWMIEDFGGDAAWQSIQVLKQAEAAYLARRGQEEQAFLAAADLAVLAHLLEMLDCWPSFMERSIEMQERCAQSLAELLRNTQLSEAVLARLQEQEYGPWVPSVDALRGAMAGFYAYERKLLLGPDAGEPELPPGYIPARSGWLLFKAHATLALFADSFRELQRESTLNVIARRSQIEQRLHHLSISNSGWLPGANSSGEAYYVSRIRPYADMQDRHALARAQHAAVMTLFALRRHVLAEARLPQTAADLTPKYLPRPVYDPFSGEPLRFNLSRGLIYSLGTDLKDDGGRPTVPPLGDPTEPTLETGVGIAASVSR
jgi:hypothetical protein